MRVGDCLVDVPLREIRAPAKRRPLRITPKSMAVLLVLIELPFWVSFMMRMMAWVNLFSPNGYVNNVLMWSNVVTSPPNWLDGNAVSVVLALIYG